MYFAGINFREWRLSAFFAELNIRDLAKNRELVNISSAKAFFFKGGLPFPFKMHQFGIFHDALRFAELYPH